jgi:hypothetical protein
MYFYANYSNLNDLSWMLTESFAGVTFCYLSYCPNLDYTAIAAIANSLITLKNNNEIRLDRIDIYGGLWDLNQDNGTYVKCSGSSLSPQAQLKVDLANCGNGGIHLNMYPLNTTTYPERLGSYLELPTCP